MYKGISLKKTVSWAQRGFKVNTSLMSQYRILKILILWSYVFPSNHLAPYQTQSRLFTKNNPMVNCVLISLHCFSFCLQYFFFFFDMSYFHLQKATNNHSVPTKPTSTAINWNTPTNWHLWGTKSMRPAPLRNVWLKLRRFIDGN